MEEESSSLSHIRLKVFFLEEKKIRKEQIAWGSKNGFALIVIGYDLKVPVQHLLIVLPSPPPKKMTFTFLNTLVKRCPSLRAVLNSPTLVFPSSPHWKCEERGERERERERERGHNMEMYRL